MSNRNEGYRFDIQNGAIVAVYEYEHGRFEREDIDWDESWTIDGSRIIKSEYDDGRLEHSVYTDPDGDGTYTKIGEYYGAATTTSSTSSPGTTSTTPTNGSSSDDGYQFDVSNGVVTTVYELHNGVRTIERIDANESWVVDGTDFVKLETEYGLQSTSVYSDLDNDGIYTRVSKVYNSLTPESASSTTSAVSNSGQSHGYRFDIVDGNIVSVYEIEHGLSKLEYIEPNETWTVQGDNIINIEYDHGVYKEKVFADADNDGIYTPIAQSYSSPTDFSDAPTSLQSLMAQGYQFDIVDDVVEQAYEVRDGAIRPDLLDANEHWSVDGENVIKSEIEYGVQSVTTYTDTDHDGLYERLQSTHQDARGVDLPDSLDMTPLFTSLRSGAYEYVLPEKFSGPAALNLKYQLIDDTENAILIGSMDNDFIKVSHMTSLGKAVDGADGDDVIDGGVGSTFITGGTGSNTFFLDGRASGDAWSTVTDFKLGTDKATIWGWEHGVSKVAAIEEHVGAQGYEGLTLHFENLVSDHSDSTPQADWKSITFAGKTLEDFGVDSAEALNAHIMSGLDTHFTAGQVTDELGTHGYLYIS